jgi:hypothetical protein
LNHSSIGYIINKNLLSIKKLEDIYRIQKIKLVEQIMVQLDDTRAIPIDQLVGWKSVRKQKK